jgi:hypothetical protein
MYVQYEKMGVNMIKKLVCILLVLSLLSACQPAGPGGGENQQETLNGKTTPAGKADDADPQGLQPDAPAESVVVESAGPVAGAVATPERGLTAAPDIYRVPDAEGGDLLTVIYKGAVAEKMPELFFTVLGRSDPDGMTYHAEELGITYAATGELIFGFKCDTACYREDLDLRLIDLNFDGYCDVMLHSDMGGAHGHISYLALLWENGRNTFSGPAEGFTDILNPVADAKSKAIRSRSADSAYCDIYRIYRYAAGRFYLDMELMLETNTDGGAFIRTYTEYQYTNGKPLLVNEFTTAATEEGAHTQKEKPYYEPGGIWELDNPIWMDSDHFK